MKTTPSIHHSSPCLRRGSHPAPAGFSLVELLVVVALVTMIIAVAAPYTLSAIQSANLTSAGDTLMQKLALAQQRSLTENRPVGVEFYHYTKDGVKGCHAIQMISYNPATNQVTQLEPPVYWNKQSVVIVEGALSPMFSINQT
ncbi:MAG: hypothetical protein B7Z37_28725, partial [Verrucomicrobia bacterium 12-59-8]